MNSVSSELLHNDITAEEIKAHGNAKGLFSPNTHSLCRFIVDPAILNWEFQCSICYGMQLTTHLFADAESFATREYGLPMPFNTASGIFKGLAEEEEVLMSHGDRITAIPEVLGATASNAHTPFAAFF